MICCEKDTCDLLLQTLQLELVKSAGHLPEVWDQGSGDKWAGFRSAQLAAQACHHQPGQKGGANQPKTGTALQDATRHDSHLQGAARGLNRGQPTLVIQPSASVLWLVVL